MKKLLVLFLCVLVGCSNNKNTEVTNVITEITTSDEFMEKLEFSLDVPETFADSDDIEFRVYEDLNMAEVNYLKNGNYIGFIRKIRTADLGDNMLSGMYANFTSTEKIDKFTVSLIKDDAYVSDWAQGDFTYTVVTLDGLDTNTLVELSKLVK